ncbi:MAG: FTR1 family iron permease, partial [Bifidobacteriaceae bacterium]|nr:FTR1 family iron permease [Bifidobacteriaceae bacterium]
TLGILGVLAWAPLAGHAAQAGAGAQAAQTADAGAGAQAGHAAQAGAGAQTAQTADAEDADAPATWAEVADEMAGILDDAHGLYRDGQAEAAKNRVDDAYYGYYEKLGFEKIVMGTISGERATAVEYQFAQAKKTILAGGAADQVRADLDALADMLREDGAALDASRAKPAAAFLGSLTIILREGFEAIIVVGAIVAYLIKAGRRDKLRLVYAGAGLALIASAVLAVAINALTGLAGANQEIIEGITVLVAVAMLLWVSNWIFSKAGSQSWTRYLEAKAGASLGRGSAWSLAAVAFLAVFREGAEVIIFYQALRAQDPAGGTSIWLGLGVGLVILAVVYAAIRLASVRIPLRPFFLGTSILLAVMAVSFAGSGIKELQEGNAIPVSRLGGVPTIDLLGVYPTAQTLAFQAAVLALIAALLALSARKARRLRAVPEPLTPTPELETSS